MSRVNRKLYIINFTLFLIVLMAGCAAGGSEKDIIFVTLTPPRFQVEAAAVKSATTDLSSEIVDPSPTATDYPTEIIDPISPISPIRKPTYKSMAPSKQDKVIAVAKAELAKKTGRSIDEIKVISVEAMEWSDASLGCQQEGFMYAQVITPGFLIVLEVGGEQYEYHTDQNKNVVLCEE